MDESSECITPRVIETSKRTKLSDDHIQTMMRANSGAFSQHAGASGNGDKGINTTLTNDEWLDYTFIDRDGTLELLQDTTLTNDEWLDCTFIDRDGTLELLQDVMMDETQTNVLEEATDANLSQYTNNVGGETARGNSKGLESDCKKILELREVIAKHIKAAEGAAMASEKEAKKVKEEHTKKYNELMDLYNKDQKQLQLERDLRSKAEKNAQDEGARRVASEANTNSIYDYLVLQE